MTDELDRLRVGPSGQESPQGFVVRFEAHNDEPTAVLDRMRDLLVRTIPGMATGDRQAAVAAVPDWFRDACRPEWTPEELQEEMRRRRSLSLEDRAVVERTARWSLRNWLAWLDPEQRSWWWWDGRVETDGRLVVEVLVEGHPFASGALLWMLRAVGCTEITEDGVPVDRPIEQPGRWARLRRRLGL
ncbi:MAG TPA: hypothetical protein VLW53_08495 [Candidatus Eisenbacteria bacterium]|nr:hypothetical protein [Candidatus Eisenbacteria bacterium]